MPFLLRPLSGVLSGTRLPREIGDALSIWTHVAGQSASKALAPLAFVPALIHRYGAYVPKGGMAQIPLAIEGIARKAGVEFRYGARVQKVHCPHRKVSGVEVDGQFIGAKAVICNASSIGAYCTLLDGIPKRFLARLRKLPLQSPGVCAYLVVEGAAQPPYLRFHLPGRGLCRLLVQPGVIDPKKAATARLIGPVDYGWAERAGLEGQRAYLEELLAESWWQAGFTRIRIAATRVPCEWGAHYSLYNNSMNPVMTRTLMLGGRIAHKSPIVNGLYFAGSSTHPGQWVSFCAISGILAAQQATC